MSLLTKSSFLLDVDPNLFFALSNDFSGSVVHDDTGDLIPSIFIGADNAGVVLGVGIRTPF